MKFLIPYAGAERVREVPRPKARRQRTPKNPDYIPPEMQTIVALVCDKHKVTLDMLRVHDKKNAKLHRARVDLIVQCIDAGYSRSHVGRVLHRDHSTIIHHYRVAKAPTGERKQIDPDAPFGGILSPHEQRVWELVIQGYSHQQIGEQLGITARSSRDYTTSARRKLRAQAVVERDIVEDLMVWAPLVAISLETYAGDVLRRAIEEIKTLRRLNDARV